MIDITLAIDLLQHVDRIERFVRTSYGTVLAEQQVDQLFFRQEFLVLREVWQDLLSVLIILYRLVLLVTPIRLTALATL
jgi:hypothetical protein